MQSAFNSLTVVTFCTKLCPWNRIVENALSFRDSICIWLEDKEVSRYIRGEQADANKDTARMPHFFYLPCKSCNHALLQTFMPCACAVVKESPRVTSLHVEAVLSRSGRNNICDGINTLWLPKTTIVSTMRM